jgi:plasmid stability protein
MPQITVRNLPESVEARLRQLASRTGSSLNQTVVRLLEEVTGITRPTGPKRDLTAFGGRWTSDEAAAFDEAVRQLEQLDEEVWQ